MFSLGTTKNAAFKLRDLRLLSLQQALRTHHALPQLAQHLTILVLHLLRHLLADLPHLRSSSAPRKPSFFIDFR